MNQNRRMQFRFIWEKYKYRIICVIIALIFAILTITVGFWKAVLFLLIIAIGYIIGAYLDGDIDLRN